MPENDRDNAIDIIGQLQGRELTEEEAERIILAVRSRVRITKPEAPEYDAHGIKRGVISTP